VKTQNAHKTRTDKPLDELQPMARGSINKRNNGYVYRIDLGVDPATGKRRQISRQGFKNKKAVERALAEHLEQLRSGTHVDQSKMTTAEYLEQWLDNQKLRLEPTTWASYKTAADRVTARLGARALQDVTPIEIESFYSGLAVKGTRSDRPLKAKTIRNTHTILRKALSDAERLGIVNRNAASAARPPVAEQIEQTTWSSDELRTFLGFVADDDLFAAYVLLATTGMRRGTAASLVSATTFWPSLARERRCNSLPNRSVLLTSHRGRSRVMALDLTVVKTCGVVSVSQHDENKRIGSVQYRGTYGQTCFRASLETGRDSGRPEG